MAYKGLGLGCMHMRNADYEESKAVIHTVLDEGVAFLNTGDFYSAGESEMVLGNALQGVARDNFYISVKFGVVMQPGGEHSGLDVRPHRIKEYLMHSLKKSRTKCTSAYRSLPMPGQRPRGTISFPSSEPAN